MGHDRHAAGLGPIVSIVFCAIALLSTALVSAEEEPRGELVISGSQKITDVPTRIAAAPGYFDVEPGLPIRVKLADSGKQSLDRLMAGDADFVLMNPVPLALMLTVLHQQGAPPESWPVVVASIGLSSPTNYIIADARRGIERPADLAAHALGLLVDTSAHFAWDRFADVQGIGADAVRLVNTRPDALAEGLAAGRFDAVVAWPPVSEQIVDQLGANARSFPLQAMESVSWLLVSRRPLIERHPQVVKRVLRGHAGAIDLLQTDPDRAAALLDLPRDWLQDKPVAWKLALNWSVIANMEAKLEWSARRLDMPPLRVSPRIYIERGPLERFRPGAVSLPLWIAPKQAEQ